MKSSDIRKLIKDIEAINNRGIELTNKGFITMLENLLEEKDNVGLSGMYYFDTPDQKVLKSRKYGIFVLSQFDNKVTISWYRDNTFNSEVLLPTTKSPYKWVLDFSDAPEDGWFKDFDEAEMYLNVKFGKLYEKEI